MCADQCFSLIPNYHTGFSCGKNRREWWVCCLLLLSKRQDEMQTNKERNKRTVQNVLLVSKVKLIHLGILWNVFYNLCMHILSFLPYYFIVPYSRLFSLSTWSLNMYLADHCQREGNRKPSKHKNTHNLDPCVFCIVFYQYQGTSLETYVKWILMESCMKSWNFVLWIA